MISIDTIDGVKVWNISSRVGGSSRSHIMDIKLVQWYLYVLSKVNVQGPNFSVIVFPDYQFTSRTMITGQWDQNSQDALKIYENSISIVVPDGFVDHMRPGQGFGSVHAFKVLKLYNMAGFYFAIKGGLGTDILNTLVQKSATPEAISKVMMNMGNDPDMPADLAFNLNSLAPPQTPDFSS